MYANIITSSNALHCQHQCVILSVLVQAMVAVDDRNNVIHGEIFQLGQLIMDINEERGKWI